MIKKIKNFIFLQEGKDSQIIRLFLVCLYLGLIGGIIFVNIFCYKEVVTRNKLNTEDVMEQLGWSLLHSSISSYTVNVFTDTKTFDLNKDLNKFTNGYEYFYYLILTEIPKIADQVYQETGDLEKEKNIIAVSNLLEENIEELRKTRWEYHNFYTYIKDVILSILFIVLPTFILFRTGVYRLMLYVIYGNKNKTKKEIS